MAEQPVRGDDADPRELVSTLARRQELLAELAEGEREKPDLVAACSASRSTVNRAIRDLETLGVVERRAGGYGLTLAGRLLVERFADLTAAMADVVAAGDLLSALPPDALVDPRLLRGASVSRSREPAPNRPLDHAVELVESADRLRGFLPAITLPRLPRLFHDRVCDGLDAELVYEGRLVDEVLAEQTELVAEMVAHGFRAFRAPELPFGLLVTEDDEGEHVCVAVYGERADLRGVVHNDSPPAVEWARECYAAYREEATEITAEFEPER